MQCEAVVLAPGTIEAFNFTSFALSTRIFPALHTNKYDKPKFKIPFAIIVLRF